MPEKKIYSQKAPPEATIKETVIAAAGLTVLCAVLMTVLSNLPYAGITTLLTLFLFAAGIYAVLKENVFEITYVLYEDRLVYLRRYGALEKETEVFPIGEAEFYKDKIVYRKKTYPFHPDERMKGELLR